MRAIIQRSTELPGAGLLSIAGRPLIARQIQWLRTLGWGTIAVEVGPEDGEIARWLSEEDALGAGVSIVLAGRPLAARDVARRAGFPGDAPLLVLPANAIVGGGSGARLGEARERGAWVRFDPPVGLGERFEGVILTLVPAEKKREPLLVNPRGWGARLRSHADAMALEVAILDGRLSPRPEDAAWGIQVHAAEVSPGIWIARGAVVERGGELAAPVLVGAGAVVCAGARVGPRVCLGARAVVEPGTRICDAVVCAGTIVGEELELSDVIVEPGGLRDPVSGDLHEVEDSLIFAERDPRRRGALVTRAFALGLLLLLVPWVLARLLRARLRAASARGVVLGDGRVDLVSRLLDAIHGSAPAIVGVSAWAGPFPDDVPAALSLAALSAPRGIFLVDAALAPPDADAATRLRTRAWYAHAKSPSVDAKLVLAARRARRARAAGGAAGQGELRSVGTFHPAMRR